MKRILILAAMSVVLAAPAWAEVRAQHNPVSTPDQSIDRLATQIERNARNGVISPEEAQRLRSEIVELRGLQHRHQPLTTRERSELVRRTEALRKQMLAAEQSHHGQPAAVAQRKRFPGEEPLFSTNKDRLPRTGNHVDVGTESRLDRLGRLDRGFSDRTFESRDYQYRDRDDGPHGNDLRGPPPPKHDEGD